MDSRFVEYDSEAPFYDESRFYDKLGKHLDFMHKKIIGELINPCGKFILEAGTGTGRFAVWLAGKGFKVVGIDVSRGMLRVAKGKVNILRENIDLVRADLHFLPFKNEVFDGVICVNVVNHLSSVEKFLNNVSHVLKTHGSFIFNFSNIISLYLPIAIFVNLRGKALFKHGKIRSKWFTFREIRALLNQASFIIDDIRGCMIASPLPLGEKMTRAVKYINIISLKNLRLCFLSGSIFVRAKPMLTLRDKHSSCVNL